MPTLRKSHYLVCYDICEQRRLQRLHRFIAKHGLALQRSVFLLHVNPAQRREIETELVSLANVHHDDIRLYPIYGPGAIWCAGTQAQSLSGVNDPGQVPSTLTRVMKRWFGR